MSGLPFVGDELSTALELGGPPALYLDFETMNPAIPLYPGTRPYQMLPFQWSLHEVGIGAEVSHRDFLADGGVDPRRDFVESLLDAVGDGGEPVHVYSHFESTRLKELAEEFADLAAPLARLRARLFDLFPVVKENLYYREFGCGWSIKNVAPALCPDLTYDDLEEIADGESASRAMFELARGQTQGSEATRTRQALREYCKRDTLAMVEHVGDDDSHPLRCCSASTDGEISFDVVGSERSAGQRHGSRWAPPACRARPLGQPPRDDLGE